MSTGSTAPRRLTRSARQSMSLKARPAGCSSFGARSGRACSAGDHLLVTNSVYSPTRRFCDTTLKRFGVDVEYYDPLVGAGISGLMKPNTRLILTESLRLRTFEIQDIPAIVTAAHAGGAIVVMDNTWATPVYFRALDYGVDITVHAATKYPGGHSDLLLGLVSANEKCWASSGRPS